MPDYKVLMLMEDEYGLKELVNVASIGNGFYIIILTFILVLMIPNNNKKLEDNKSKIKDKFILLLLITLIIPIHEGVHFLTSKLLGYQDIKWSLFYNEINEPLLREHFMLIAMMPLIIISFILLILLYFFKQFKYILMILLLIHFGGCKSDIEQFRMLIGFDKDVFVSSIDGKTYYGFKSLIK